MRTHGFTSAVRPPDDSDEKKADERGGGDGRWCLAVLTALCAHGNLEDFMAREGAPLSVAVKLDLMLQVARGLEALKKARVLWRDLKAKNLLVSDVLRGRTGEVVKVCVKFTDWGTAVKMPKTDEGESRRRMTLHGPGTAGYIAPDTRGPMYDYQADMWAYLVWAASMCLAVPCVVDCQLEEALAGLRLEKKANATAGHEAKVEQVLVAFEAARKVEPECDALFELLKTSAPWVDAQLRWTPEEAAEELEQFRADHALALAPGERDARRALAGAIPPVAEEATREEVVTLPARQILEADAERRSEAEDGDEDEAALSARGAATEAAETKAADSDSAGRLFLSQSVATTALALVDEGAAERRAAAAALRARAEQLKREAERLEAEAEAVSEGEPETSLDEKNASAPRAFPEESAPKNFAEEARRAARAEAALASARWVGARVRVWVPASAHREKSKKGMLRVKKRVSGAFRDGVIIKTRAAFVGAEASSSPRGASDGARSWVVACLARFEDGEEKELTLAEAAACAASAADRDGDDTNNVFDDDDVRVDVCADEDAETEPVGSAFVRGAAAREKNATPSSRAQRRSLRGAEPLRAREAEETSTSMRQTRSRARPPLGALSSNEAAGRAASAATAKKRKPNVFGEKPLRRERTLAAARETNFNASVETTAELRVPESLSSGSGSGKRRGRKAPDWAVAAVEVMGAALGCAKCRQSRYGCGACRERAGICDPENPPVLALPYVEDGETAEREPGTRKRGRAAAAPAAASAAKPHLAVGSTHSQKRARRRRGASGTDPFVNVGDISDVTTKAELKKRLPRGVKLGCAKCRQAWRGCGACRKANGVWIAPASNWVARGASLSPPGGALALPAC